MQNVLYGRNGAAYVFAPQKGADEKQVVLLDHGLKNLADVIQSQTGKDISDIPGTGAAGGIAAGLLPFFDVEMKNGIELIIAASNVEEHLASANLVVTGEGKIDSQSGSGKVVGHLATLAKKYGLDCIAFCGSTELDEIAIRSLGVKKIITLIDEATSRDEAITNAANLLEEKASRMIKIL